MFQQNILEELKNKLYLIAGDASFRKFYRFKSSKGKILVYCNRSKKTNLANYVKVNNFLIKNKFLAPKVIKNSINKNYLIIQDLGNVSFKKYILSKKNKFIVFKKILDELIKIQKIKVKKQFSNYNQQKLKKELSLFFEWYLPEFFNNKKIRKIRNNIERDFLPRLANISKKEKVFVHRDFHLENLILFKNKIGIIDSQDAVIGHPAYDLASLVDDVRLKISPKDQSKIIEYYLKNTKHNSHKFIYDFHVLSIQRLLKILGIFVRLYRRDNKKQYLKYLKYTWYLLDKRLKYPELKNLSKIFNLYFNKKIKNRSKWN
ncbi:MAG: phosphotransferase [Pelagibacteraceae bacterium]